MKVIQTIRSIHGECLEEMAKFTDGSIDAVIADIPYGTTGCKWDSIIPFGPMWEQLHRIIKPNGVIALFGCEPFASALRMSNIKNYKYDWVWSKSTSAGFIHSKNKPLRRTENIAVFSLAPMGHQSLLGDRRMIYYPQGLEKCERDKSRRSKGKGSIIPKRKSDRDTIATHKNYPKDILEFKRGNNKNIHPTQKPVPLMEYLIKTYTVEGETVLDFTMGSGTTGVACLNTDRNFIGIEKDEKYYKLAVERIGLRSRELSSS